MHARVRAFSLVLTALHSSLSTPTSRKQEAAARRRRSLQQQGKGRKRLCGSDRQPLRQLSASQAARGAGAGSSGARRASAPSDLKENRASWANTSYASVSSTIGKSGLGASCGRGVCMYVCLDRW